MRARLPEDGTARHWLTVQQSTATIACIVAIENFIVFSRLWHPDTIAMAWYGSEITHTYQRIITVLTASHKRDHTIVRVIAINPRETARIAIECAESWFVLIEPVEVPHKIV